MNCKASKRGEFWVCDFCGFTHDTPFKRNCPLAGKSLKLSDHRGLGDTLSAYLLHWGVKAEAGCDCDWRRSYLNSTFPYDPKQFYRNLWRVGWLAVAVIAFPVVGCIALHRHLTTEPEIEAARVARQRREEKLAGRQAYREKNAEPRNQ